MAKQEKDAPEKAPAPEAPLAERPRLEPIGTVRRTLVRPDGRKISVDVPVYPPFRLDPDAQAPQKPAPRRPRKGAKPRPTGSD